MSTALTDEEQAQYTQLRQHIDGKHVNSVPPAEQERLRLWQALEHAGDTLAAEYYRYALRLTSSQPAIFTALLALDVSKLPASSDQAITEVYQNAHVRLSRESWPHYAAIVRRVMARPTAADYAELRALYQAARRTV